MGCWMDEPTTPSRKRRFDETIEPSLKRLRIAPSPALPLPSAGDVDYTRTNALLNTLHHERLQRLQFSSP